MLAVIFPAAADAKPLGDPFAAEIPTLVVSRGTPLVRWSEPAVLGANPAFVPELGGPCAKAPSVSLCDEKILRVDIAPKFWEHHKGGVTIQITPTHVPTRLDVYVYRRKPDGTRGALIAMNSRADDDGQTGMRNLGILNASGEYVLTVVYVGMFEANGYNGRLALVPSEQATLADRAITLLNFAGSRLPRVNGSAQDTLEDPSGAGGSKGVCCRARRVPTTIRSASSMAAGCSASGRSRATTA